MAQALFNVRYRKVVNHPEWVAENTMEHVGVEGDVMVFLLRRDGSKNEKVRVHKRNLVSMDPAGKPGDAR